MRIKKIGRGALALLALGLAPVLALQAQVNAKGIAPFWAMSWNGFRLADIAAAQVKPTIVNKQLDFEVSPEALAMARRAYTREPFATNSIFVISAQQSMDRAGLLQASRKLDRRNRMIGAVLLQEAAQRRDLPAVFAIINSLARIQPSLSSELVKAFSTALSDPQSIPYLMRELRKRPSWANAFWRAVPAQQPALANFVDLRRRIAAGSDEESDRLLIAALVEAGDYREAFDFREGLPHGSDAKVGNAPAQYPPLDWQLTQGGELHVRLDSSNELDVFVERGTSGVIARKLVRLSPGVYKLSGDVNLQQGSGSITAQLSCVPHEDAVRWDTHPIGPDAIWKVSTNSCRYAWLLLKGSAWDSQLPLRAKISGLVWRGNDG